MGEIVLVEVITYGIKHAVKHTNTSQLCDSNHDLLTLLSIEAMNRS